MGTTFEGLFQYGGQPVGGMLGSSPFGNAFFVSYGRGSDANDGKSPLRPFKTFSKAIATVVSDHNDVIYIDGDDSVVETAMVSIPKNRITVIGCNGFPGHYGQGAKIHLGVTTAATDIATVQNTGVRNCFVGIKFTNANTVAEGIYGFAEGGEYTRFFNCEFYKETDLDVTTASEFLHNGDSTQFYNCTFGSSANIIADNVIRPNVSVTATLDGKKCRDTYFENCIFLAKSGGTEHVFVYGANATDVERMLLMNGCMFINSTLAAADPAHAVGFGAAQTQGAVLLKDCATAKCTVLAQASVGITVVGVVSTFATSGKGVDS